MRMQTRRLAAIALGVLFLTSGCASAIDGQAKAGTTGPPAASTDVSDTAGGSTAPTGDDPAITTPSEPPATTSRSAVPPVDPTVPTTSSDPGTVETTEGDTAGVGDPLALPPFQGATMADPSKFPGTVTDLGFQSPTGNIACGFYEDGAVCQITEYDYAVPPRPADCGDTGWGFNFGTDRVGGFMFCAGDVEGGGPALAYGQQLAQGDIHCVSREDGVTCVSIVSGGGFFLSRDAYQLF